VKKLIVATMSMLLVLFASTADYQKEVDRRTVPEKIMESVVAVDRSSGIVVHSEENRALILTAYHTIAGRIRAAACCGCDYGIHAYHFKNPEFVLGIEKYEVIGVDFDPITDLAILEVKTNEQLDSVKISTVPTKYGDIAYVGANPLGLYRSFKQGVVSANLRIIAGRMVMEVDSGIVFGSSGGGVFNEAGDLIGIVRSVKGHTTDYCFDLWNEEGEWEGKRCVAVPLPFIGFAVHQLAIRGFLLHGRYSDDFSYLK